MQEDTLVNKPYQIDLTYHFDFPDESKVSFPVKVDLSDINYTDPVNPPEWVKIENHQCPDCPLKNQNTKTCPAAVAIMDVVEYFSENGHHETAVCRVEMDQKTTAANQPLVNSLTALIGLKMASSMCPVLAKLRPMARFHDPFGDSYSIVYRAASMHVLRQFLRQDQGKTPYSMTDLIKVYEKIAVINRYISERLKTRDKTCKPCSFQLLSVFSLNVTLLLDEHLKILKRLMFEFSLEEDTKSS